MIILKTSPDNIEKVVELSKHALHSRPNLLKEDDLILISQTITKTKDGGPPIRYVMKFSRIYPDLKGESKKIWGQEWRFIVEGKDCRRLKQPFDIMTLKISARDYGRGGPYVYVAPEDEQIIKEKGLLETV